MLYTAWYEFSISTDQSVRRYQPPTLRSWTLIDSSNNGERKERSYSRDGMNQRQIRRFFDECQLYSVSRQFIPADEPYVEFTTDGQDSSGAHWYAAATILPFAEPDKGETDAMQLQAALRIQKRYAPGWCVLDCQRCKRMMADNERGGWVAGKFDGNNYYQSLLVCQDCWDELKQREASGTLESGVGSLSFLRQLGPTE